MLRYSVNIVALYSVLFALFLAVYSRLSRRAIDLVIARYNEDLQWLRRIDTTKFNRIYVYNKGAPGFVPPVPGCIAIDLPNVGREAHTYINHVVANYGVKLGDVTVFVPGSCDMPHKWDKALSVIQKAIKTGDTVFLSDTKCDDVREAFYAFTLDVYEARTQSNTRANPEKNLLKSPERPFGKWYEKNFGDYVARDVSYYGIFAVSKKDILKRSVNSYLKLNEYVNSHSSPEVAHYLERTWHVVFSKGSPLPDIQYIRQNIYFSRNGYAIDQ